MRIIQVNVAGYQANKDSRTAGVQGEGNAASLRLTFSEDWDGLAKKITWVDASGGNPVEVTLGADLLEDILTDTRTYLTAIPPEPLAKAGSCMAVLDGYQQGKRARSIPMQFKVEAAPFFPDAAEPTDPTPSQAEQLQAQIDAMLGTMQGYAQSANASAGAAADAQTGAEEAESEAQLARDGAETARGGAEDAQEAAEAARDAAQAAKAGAEAAQEAAEAARNAAQDAVGKTSYIGENGNWFEWRNGTFVDSGVAATQLVDQNGQPVRMWFGTVAEYNALTEIRSDTYYNILEGSG